MLWYNAAARQRLTSVQHRRLCALFHEYGTAHIPYPEPLHATHILLALRIQIQRALADTNLGKWAQLLQYIIPYWPYKQHPALRLLRRKAYQELALERLPTTLRNLCLRQSTHGSNLCGSDYTNPSTAPA